MSQIKQHSANGRNYTIVQVPKDAQQFRLLCENGYCILEYKTANLFFGDGKQEDLCVGDIDLPFSKYTILFIAEGATGQQAHSIVDGADKSILLYKDYECKRDGYLINTSSLHSLIRSLFPNWVDCKHVILERHD